MAILTNMNALLIAVFLANVVYTLGSGCTDNGECVNYGGECFLKGTMECNGTDWHKGCSNADCSCCVPDTSICIAKPWCLNRGGSCVKYLERNCKGSVNPRRCHGDDCGCCIKNECEGNKQDCFRAGGFCYVKSEYTCPYTIDDTLCKNSGCACCIP